MVQLCDLQCCLVVSADLVLCIERLIEAMLLHSQQVQGHGKKRDLESKQGPQKDQHWNSDLSMDR